MNSNESHYGRPWGQRRKHGTRLHVPLCCEHILLVVMAALLLARGENEERTETTPPAVHDNSAERVVHADAFVHHLVAVLVDVLAPQLGQLLRRPVDSEVAAVLAALLLPVLREGRVFLQTSEVPAELLVDVRPRLHADVDRLLELGQLALDRLGDVRLADVRL
eukprot:2830493-Pyramimonas_sp.AAC.1